MNSKAYKMSKYNPENPTIFRQVIQNEMKLDFRFNCDEKTNIFHVLAYNVVKTNNIHVFLDRNSLVFQAGLEQHYSKPIRAHLLDRINLHILNSGDIQVVSSVLVLNPLFHYTIKSYHFLLDNLIRVEIAYETEQPMNNLKNNSLRINHKRIESNEEVY